MLHAAWQNEITLSYNPSSIQLIYNDVYSNNINIILIQEAQFTCITEKTKRVFFIPWA